MLCFFVGLLSHNFRAFHVSFLSHSYLNRRQHYASDLGELKNDDKRATAGLACLNHFVANALEHIPDVLSYMSRIRDPKIFRFCAIPQVWFRIFVAADSRSLAKCTT